MRRLPGIRLPLRGEQRAQGGRAQNTVDYGDRNPFIPCVRICSSTNMRIVEDKLPCWRVLLIPSTRLDTVAPWTCAICFRSFQKTFSRLTLVLCPLTTTECLTTAEVFMMSTPNIVAAIIRVIRHRKAAIEYQKKLRGRTLKCALIVMAGGAGLPGMTASRPKCRLVPETGKLSALRVVD